MRLEGRTALVTGASRGIGLAIARALLAEGATVVISSRKIEGLKAAKAELDSDRVHIRACHVGKPDQIEALLDWMDSELSVPDILVNNAAANPYFGPFMGLEMPAWDKTFEVNVKGPFQLMRGVAKRLIAAGQPGSFINVSSVFGLTAAPFQGVYAMSKAAVISMSKTLAFEWGPAGIRVNVVAPGLVDTRFAAAITSNPALAERFTSRTAVNRVGQPDEISGIVTYLASDQASFTTGQVFTIDGGYTSS